jgi:peptidase M1-like protein
VAGNVCVVFAVGKRLRPALLLLALLAALAPAAPADAASARWPHPQRYSVALRYDARARTLSGTERIAFLNDGPRKLGTVWLRVWANAYGSCKHRWARVEVVSGGHSAGYARSCTALRVRLARPLLPGDSTELRLRIRVTVPPLPNRFGFDSGVAYFGNALPLLAVQDARGARIEPYTDIGDPFYSLSSTWSVRLDVPPGLAAATTGSVTRTQKVAKRFRRLSISAPHARDFAIVLGRMSVDSTRTAGGIGLRRYRLPGQSRSAALRTLAVAGAAVERYSAWFGPPGDRQIDLVASPGSLGAFGEGMEFPGLVLTGDPPLLVAHELAHQWWYGVVGDDQWRSPWLDESFAEYSSRRLPASVVGRDGLRCNRSNPVRPFGDDPLTASMGHWDAVGAGAYFAVVYLGGTCALRSLEQDIGSGAMTAFLRSYFESHRYGVTTTADFVAALRAAAPSGYDVDAYLRRARIAGS